jgi:chemotaxis protein methyltransferase CheR
MVREADADSEPMMDELTSRDFLRLSSFIRDYSGIALPESRKTMVEGRLRRRARALGLDSLGAYCRTLFEGGGLDHEAVGLIDAVTTNKTDFFREMSHFDFLANEVLPSLAADDRQSGFRQPLKVWSAACSNGAEPYSIAMVLEDFATALRGFQYHVLATDICSEVLQIAQEAIYPLEMLDPVPEPMRRRHILKPRDPGSRCFRIAPSLRTGVSFGRLNLMDEVLPVDNDFDIIFCRNILIYFDRETQRKVVSRLLGHLRKGGYFFLGHTESVFNYSLPLRSVINSVFQKI